MLLPEKSCTIKIKIIHALCIQNIRCDNWHSRLIVYPYSPHKCNSIIYLCRHSLSIRWKNAGIPLRIYQTHFIFQFSFGLMATIYANVFQWTTSSSFFLSLSFFFIRSHQTNASQTAERAEKINSIKCMPTIVCCQ